MTDTTQPRWTWNTSVDVRGKNCLGCKKPMYLDIHHAVMYQGAHWHLHCLLDMLAEYHYNNATVKVADEDTQKHWAFVP